MMSRSSSISSQFSDARSGFDDGRECSVGLEFELNASMTVPVVRRIKKGGASEFSGVRIGDQLVCIDGLSVEGHPLTLVCRRIRGRRGTTVRLTFKRFGPDMTKRWPNKSVPLFGDRDGVEWIGRESLFDVVLARGGWAGDSSMGTDALDRTGFTATDSASDRSHRSTGGTQLQEESRKQQSNDEIETQLAKLKDMEAALAKKVEALEEVKMTSADVNIVSNAEGTKVGVVDAEEETGKRDDGDLKQEDTREAVKGTSEYLQEEESTSGAQDDAHDVGPVIEAETKPCNGRTKSKAARRVNFERVDDDLRQRSRTNEDTVEDELRGRMSEEDGVVSVSEQEYQMSSVEWAPDAASVSDRLVQALEDARKTRAVCDALRSRNVLLQITVETSHKRIAELEEATRRLEAVEEEKRVAKEAVASLEGRAEAQLERIEELKGKLKGQEEWGESGRMREEMKALVAQMERDRRGWEEEKRGWEEERGAFERERAGWKDALAEFEETKGLWEAEAGCMAEDRRRWQAEREAVDEEKAGLEEDARQLRQRAAEMEHEGKVWAKEKAAVEEGRRELEQTLLGFEDQILQVEAEKSKWKEEKAQLVERVQQLEAASVGAENREVEHERAEIEHERAEIEQMRDEIEKEKAEIEQERLQWEEESALWEEERKVWEEERLKAEAERTALVEEKRRGEEERDRWSEKFMAVEEARKELSEKVSVLEAEVRKLERESDEQQEQVAQLEREQLQCVNANAKDGIVVAPEDVRDAPGRVSELEEELESARKGRDVLEGRLRQMQQENVSLREAVTALELERERWEQDEMMEEERRAEGGGNDGEEAVRSPDDEIQTVADPDASCSPLTEAKALHALRSPSVPEDWTRSLAGEREDLEQRMREHAEERRALFEDRARYQADADDLAQKRAEVDDLLRACEEAMSELEGKRSEIDSLLRQRLHDDEGRLRWTESDSREGDETEGAPSHLLLQRLAQDGQAGGQVQRLLEMNRQMLALTGVVEDEAGTDQSGERPASSEAEAAKRREELEQEERALARLCGELRAEAEKLGGAVAEMEERRKREEEETAAKAKEGEEKIATMEARAEGCKGEVESLREEVAQRKAEREEEEERAEAARAQVEQLSVRLREMAAREGCKQGLEEEIAELSAAKEALALEMTALRERQDCEMVAVRLEMEALIARREAQERALVQSRVQARLSPHKPPHSDHGPRESEEAQREEARARRREENVQLLKACLGELEGLQAELQAAHGDLERLSELRQREEERVREAGEREQAKVSEVKEEMAVVLAAKREEERYLQSVREERRRLEDEKRKVEEEVGREAGARQRREVLEEEMEVLRESVVVLKAEKREVEEGVRGVAEAKRELQREASQLTDWRSEIYAEVKALQAERAELLKARTQLRQEEEEERAVVLKSMAELKQAEEATAKELGEVEQVLKHMEGVRCKEESRLREWVQAETDKCQQELATLRAEAAQRRAEAAAAAQAAEEEERCKLAEAVREREGVEEEMRVMREALKTLEEEEREKLQGMVEERGRWEAACAEEERAAQARREEAAAAHALESDALQREIEQRRADLDRLFEELARAEKELAPAQATAEAAECKAAALTGQLEALEVRHTAEEGRVAALQTEREAVAQEATRLSAEVDKLQSAREREEDGRRVLVQEVEFLRARKAEEESALKHLQGKRASEERKWEEAQGLRVAVEGQVARLLEAKRQLQSMEELAGRVGSRAVVGDARGLGVARSEHEDSLDGLERDSRGASQRSSGARRVLSMSPAPTASPPRRPTPPESVAAWPGGAGAAGAGGGVARWTEPKPTRSPHVSRQETSSPRPQHGGALPSSKDAAVDAEGSRPASVAACSPVASHSSPMSDTDRRQRSPSGGMTRSDLSVPRGEHAERRTALGGSLPAGGAGGEAASAWAANMRWAGLAAAREELLRACGELNESLADR